VLHISVWGIEAFFGVLSGDGTEFWDPYVSVGPLAGGYGVQLIQLCLRWKTTMQTYCGLIDCTGNSALKLFFVVKASW